MFRSIKQFLFSNTSTRQTVAKNTFWLAFGEITSRLLRMAVVVFAARLLGASGWGVFSYALTIEGLFAIVAGMGLGPFLTREVSQNPAQQKEYFSTSFFLQVGLVVISSLLILFGAPYVISVPETIPLLSLVVVVLAFDVLRDFLMALARAFEKMELEAMIKLVTNVCITGLGIFFLFLSASPSLLLWAYGIGTGVGLLLSLFVLRSHIASLFSSFRSSLLWTIFIQAWPFALIGFLGALMINIDVLMLGWWRSPEEIGYYAAIQRIIQVLYILPSFLVAALFPTFARLAKSLDNSFVSVAQKALRIIYLFGVPLVVGGIILSHNIILTLFGQEYAPAIIPFQLLLFSILIMYSSHIVSNAIFAHNKQKYFVILLLLGVVGDIIANIFLIPPYGIVGSAIATLIAQALAYGFGWFVLKKLRAITFLSLLKKIIPSALGMGVVVYGMNAVGFPLLVTIGGGIVAYLIFLLFLQEPSLKELHSILSQ